MNFFDVRLPGPVTIRDCHFKGGTNLLLYAMEPYGVTETFPLQVLGNSGMLKSEVDGLS
ncbi:hypothetical protein ACFSC4_22525 [Deinococcus malanensis]|uniref:hypothetical protein n=1 Tax=Deinococcus malanensis TaxID=1706855 RepID=UPI00362DF4FF